MIQNDQELVVTRERIRVAGWLSLPRSGCTPQPRVALRAPWETIGPLSVFTAKRLYNAEHPMSQALSQVCLHVVFSTKNRARFLQDPMLRDRTYAYLAGTCRNLESPSIIVAGVEDHVHVLCRLAKTLSVSELVRELKTGIVEMAEGAIGRSGFVLLAERLRSVLHQPGTCGTVEGLHSKSGRTPQERDISGRIPAITGEVRDRIRRAIRMGLIRVVKPLRGKDKGEAIVFPGYAKRDPGLWSATASR